MESVNNNAKQKYQESEQTDQIVKTKIDDVKEKEIPYNGKEKTEISDSQEVIQKNCQQKGNCDKEEEKSQTGDIMNQTLEQKKQVYTQQIQPSNYEQPQAIRRRKSLKEFTVSVDLFVQLKKGSIQEYYDIGKILGEGAFGKVYQVTHKTTSIMRAMKTILKKALIKEDQQKLFQEMNILKNLDHPNILRLFELYQDNKCFYLITEYCSGGELFDKIKTFNNFTEKMAAHYIKQVLSAIVYCHSTNIVHRNLKPENLIFDSNKENANLKVIDFGTCRKFDTGKKMKKRLGTPYYIAPEVLSQNYDEKCDVWSLGVILFILLCSYPPFGVKKGIVKFDPQDWEKISPEAITLIKRMLTHDPQQRISSQEALNDHWIQKLARQTNISKKVMYNLTQFYTRSKLKQAIMAFIVSQVVTQNDKEEIQKNLDGNGDGLLSLEELIQGYAQVYGDPVKEKNMVTNILEAVDINCSAKIDFSEFLMASMGKDLLLSRIRVEQAFKLFDYNGNGQIERNELENIIGDIDDDFWKEVLVECDTNKDGLISQDEFVTFLQNGKLDVLH